LRPQIAIWRRNKVGQILLRILHPLPGVEVVSLHGKRRISDAIAGGLKLVEDAIVTTRHARRKVSAHPLHPATEQPAILAVVPVEEFLTIPAGQGKTLAFPQRSVRRAKAAIEPNVRVRNDGDVLRAGQFVDPPEIVFVKWPLGKGFQMEFP